MKKGKPAPACPGFKLKIWAGVDGLGWHKYIAFLKVNRRDLIFQIFVVEAVMVVKQ